MIIEIRKQYIRIKKILSNFYLTRRNLFVIHRFCPQV